MKYITGCNPPIRTNVYFRKQTRSCGSGTRTGTWRSQPAFISCLGAPLARLELLCALEIMVRYFSSIRLDPHHAPVVYPTHLFNAVEELFLEAQRV